MEKKKHIGRRFIAIVAGIIIGAALSLLTDFALEKAGVFPKGAIPTTNLFILATFYRTVYTILSGYITAWISTKPKHDTITLATIAVIVNAIGLITTWNLNLGPHWYPIALTLLAYPAVYAGGWIRLNF